MSNNNRADSNDKLSTDMDKDRRDGTADRGRRDDAVDHGNRDDTADHGRRDDAVDHGHRDDAVDHGHRDDTADHGRRDANDDHGYRDDNANRERRDNNANQANSGGSGKWLSPLIALLGLWMIAMTLVLDVAGSHFWSGVLAGALLVGVGAYNYSRRSNEQLANSAIALIAVATGLWLIAAPYVLGGDAGLSESAYDLWFYNHLAVGLLAAALGAYSAYTARDHQRDTSRTNA